jgi:hypothetical protein
MRYWTVRCPNALNVASGVPSTILLGSHWLLGITTNARNLDAREFWF